MKKVIFALAIFSSSISYCQFPKAVVNTKVFNFNLTSKIPLNITDPKSLGRKIMNGSITTLYKYSVNNTEHLVLIPSDTIPGPQIHFIKKNNEWTFENYYTQLKLMELEVILKWIPWEVLYTPVTAMRIFNLGH
jgi:hypothetical protein